MKNQNTPIAKQFFLKITTIAVFLWSISVLNAQENSISPLFGISNSATSFQNDLNAINQTIGEQLTIESFSNINLLGLDYTVSTQPTSNVDKLYILKTPTEFVVYDLPYFFDPNYNGEQTSITLSAPVSDIDYHQNSTTIFAYSLATQELSTLLPFSGAVQNSYSIPFTSLETNFILKTLDNYAVLKGKENDSTKLLFYNLQSNTSQLLTLNTLYKSFYTVSNKNLNLLYAVAQDLDDVNWLLEIDPSNTSTAVISALPSCSNCAQESFNFDQNALTLDWEKQQLIAVLNQNQNSVDNYSLLTINLIDGEIENFVSLEGAMSNLYFNKAAADLVFPGDANHDGVVNTRDLLPIGLRYTYNTTPRFTQNIDWIGQHAFNTGVMAQGVDVKHADCNGDGQINALDLEAIKANYSSVHNSNKSASASNGDCDYPLGFSFTELAYEGNNVSVNIKLGESFDPVVDVYGVSFTIYYDNSFVVQNSMQTVGMNSWFGNDGGNCIHTSQDDFINGKIDITLTGVDLLNRSGGGDIITASWTIEEIVVPIAQQTSQMNLRIDDVYIINLAEEELESCGTENSLEISRKNTVGIERVNASEISIYPNPATSEINIVSDKTIETLKLLSIAGEKIQNIEYNASKTINVSTIAKGIYILKINTEEGTFFEKIVVQ